MHHCEIDHDRPELKQGAIETTPPQAGLAHQRAWPASLIHEAYLIIYEAYLIIYEAYLIIYEAYLIIYEALPF